MDFNLTATQERLVNLFADFGKQYFTRENIIQWSRDEGVPDEVAKAFVDLYYGYPELFDNPSKTAFSLMSQTLILEELSRIAGTTLPFQNDLFNLCILEQFASHDELAPVLEDYRTTGRLQFALAISEPEAGSDTMNMLTATHTRNGQVLLNGIKSYVNNGEYAPYLLVAAIDEDNENPGKYPSLSFWLIPRDLDGIRAYPLSKIGQPMLPFATIKFDDVVLDPSWRLTNDNDGFRTLFHLLEIGRVFICASSVGMAQAAMDDACAHANKRQAFGKTIGTFQQIETMLTDMEVALLNMRQLLYRAAWDVDMQSDRERLNVALMKRYIPITATEVASKAMQILGGRGYSEVSRTGGIWQDCRGNEIAEGTDEIMVYIAAPLILNSYESSPSS